MQTYLVWKADLIVLIEICRATREILDSTRLETGLVEQLNAFLQSPVHLNMLSEANKPYISWLVRVATLLIASNCSWNLVFYHNTLLTVKKISEKKSNRMDTLRPFFFFLITN